MFYNTIYCRQFLIRVYHFGYLAVQIAVLEEQKNEDAENEAAEKGDDDDNSIDIDPGAAKSTTPKGEVLDEKPDINDVPMEERQVKMLTPHILVLYFITTHLNFGEILSIMETKFVNANTLTRLSLHVLIDKHTVPLVNNHGYCFDIKREVNGKQE